MTHSFFKNYANLNYLNSIRPGKKVGDPTVQDIRALRYNPSGSIDFKLRHSEDWKELPIRINRNPSKEVTQLYNERVKITKDKFEDLQSLKSTLEKDYHLFYDDLPHD